MSSGVSQSYLRCRRQPGPPMTLSWPLCPRGR
jgi:hypothetical protein